MTHANTLEYGASLDELRKRLHEKLHKVMPEFEIDLKAGIAHQINLLKKEMNAVILGHNYMEPALYHSVPDYVGDSLHLSAVSAKTSADIIVFCGVWFMGETAKVLNPEKTVLVPSDKAGCSLAAGIKASDVRALKAKYPGAPVVSYVNTYADVKAESDYCCTSGNAAQVLRHLADKGHQRIIFLPDEFLARNSAAETGLAYAPALDDAQVAALPTDRPAVLGWNVRCEVHELFTPQDVDNIRRQFPDAAILAHPECSPEVIAKSDVSGSTKAMVDYIEQVDAPQYALLTECSMGDNMAGQFPHREMIRSCNLRCQHMNQITLEDTLAALQKIQYKVELDGAIIQAAKKPIDRMLEIR
ncbi:MAG: quinolinate synthase NadA [Candidatus Hydrogenedentes bacterium]|nr:quinolinate synthase NadA [Candidatus Hydrogenedentota bacterium]